MIESPGWTSRKDESIHKVAGAAQLKRYGRFFESLAESAWTHPTSLENVLEGPIRLVYKPTEDMSLLALAEMENKTYSKILAAVAGTCREIQHLQAEAKEFHCKLLFLGERASDENLDINELVSSLQDLSVFANRAHTVANLGVRQLSSLGEKEYEVYLPTLVEHVLDMFCLLVGLDEVVEWQPSILERWKKYRVQVRSVAHNSMRSAIPEARLAVFEKLLKDLHEQLLAKKLFARALEGAMDVGKSAAMHEHLQRYLRSATSEVESSTANGIIAIECSPIKNLAILD